MWLVVYYIVQDHYGRISKFCPKIIRLRDLLMGKFWVQPLQFRAESALPGCNLGRTGRPCGYIPDIKACLQLSHNLTMESLWN